MDAPRPMMQSLADLAQLLQFKYVTFKSSNVSAPGTPAPSVWGENHPNAMLKPSERSSVFAVVFSLPIEGLRHRPSRLRKRGLGSPCSRAETTGSPRRSPPGAGTAEPFSGGTCGAQADQRPEEDSVGAPCVVQFQNVRQKKD